MYRQFTEQGTNVGQVYEKIHEKYGMGKITILKEKQIKLGGLLGLFGKRGIECTGHIFLGNEKSRTEESRREILISQGKGHLLYQKPEASRGTGGRDIEKMMKMLQHIDEKLEKEEKSSPQKSRHPSLEAVKAVLEENEFSDSHIESLLERAERELSIKDLDEQELVEESVAEWLSESFPIYREPKEQYPRIMALIGPTGVGKTTTIAKLAALHCLKQREGEKSEVSNVSIITIDSYRIGAKNQIETYGNIMNIPVISVDKPEDMAPAIEQCIGSELILIDTFGNNPKDYIKLTEVRRFLNSCGPRLEQFLTISGTTKTRDAQEIITQFEAFKYDGVILTKVDETAHIGNLLATLIDNKKPLSHLTTGQQVPTHIEKASVEGLLNLISGIQYNGSRIKRKFKTDSRG